MDIRKRTRRLIRTLANGNPSLNYIGAELDAIARAWLVAQGGSLQEYEKLTTRSKYESFPDDVCAFARSYDEIEGTDPETHHCLMKYWTGAEDKDNRLLLDPLCRASRAFGIMCEAKLEERLGPWELRSRSGVYVLYHPNKKPLHVADQEKAEEASRVAWTAEQTSRYQRYCEELQDELLSFLPHVKRVKVAAPKVDTLSAKLDVGVVRDVVRAFESGRINTFADYKKVTPIPPAKLIDRIRAWKETEEKAAALKILLSVQNLRPTKRSPRT